MNLLAVFRRALPLVLGMTLSATIAAQGSDEPAAQRDNRSGLSLTPLRTAYSASLDKGVAISGSAVRTLEKRGDGTWLYQFNVDSFLADIEESLVLRWQDGRVIPLTYRYKLSGFMISDRRRAIDFNWDTNTATGHFRSDHFTLELKPGALDPLGYQLQLLQDLKAGKTEMAYSVIDDGRYDEDRFEVIGEETRDTKLGRMPTIKLEKVRSPDSRRQTTMWFAPELDHLLVRLVQVEPDGTRYEIRLDSAELAPGD